MPPGISELTPLNVNYKKKTPPNFFRKISFQWLFTGQNIIFSKDMSNNMRILFMNLSKFLYSKCHVLILWFFPKCKSYNPNMVRSQLRHLLAYVLWLDNLYLELLSHFCHVCSMVLDSEKLDLHIELLHPNNINRSFPLGPLKVSTLCFYVRFRPLLNKSILQRRVKSLFLKITNFGAESETQMPIGKSPKSRGEKLRLLQ